MIFNLNKQGYILNGWKEIEQISYRDYLREFGSDETTTPRGVAPRLYVDGNTVMSWGVTGNRQQTYSVCKNKREATKILYEIWERNLEDNWDAPRFFNTKKELFEDLADTHSVNIKVIKRYFKIKEAVEFAKALAKRRYDNRPLTTVDEMLNYINSNKESIKQTLKELAQLKREERKDEWHTKANALVQKVSKNDFRTIGWKEVFNLTKSQVSYSDEG